MSLVIEGKNHSLAFPIDHVKQIDLTMGLTPSIGELKSERLGCNFRLFRATMSMWALGCVCCSLAYACSSSTPFLPATPATPTPVVIRQIPEVAVNKDVEAAEQKIWDRFFPKETYSQERLAGIKKEIESSKVSLLRNWDINPKNLAEVSDDLDYNTRLAYAFYDSNNKIDISFVSSASQYFGVPLSEAAEKEAMAMIMKPAVKPLREDFGPGELNSKNRAVLKRLLIPALFFKNLRSTDFSLPFTLMHTYYGGANTFIPAERLHIELFGEAKKFSYNNLDYEKYLQSRYLNQQYGENAELVRVSTRSDIRYTMAVMLALANSRPEQFLR